MEDVEFIVDKYGDTLYRICYIRLGNIADAEDALQDTYLKYMKKHPVFSSEDHRKSWLIRVAINTCKDILRRKRAHATEDLDKAAFIAEEDFENENGVIRTLMLLPEKYSVVMILHFAEGHNYKTIASIIGKSESAVKMRIKKGRELFFKLYEKENIYYE